MLEMKEKKRKINKQINKREHRNIISKNIYKQISPLLRNEVHVSIISQMHGSHYKYPLLKTIITLKMCTHPK